MSKSFFTVCDNDGMYTDDECVYYDKREKKYCYLSYPNYYNHVLLGITYDIAYNMLIKLDEFCRKHNIHKSFEVIEVFIQ